MNEESHSSLILEDHLETAETLAKYVASLGHRYRIATTLDELDAAMAEGPYCYALVDKELPVTKGATPVVATGDTAQKRLRATDPRRNDEDHHFFPIIVISGKSREASFMGKSYTLGATSFIPKPADAETVTSEILATLARARREDHAACAACALRKPAPEPEGSPLVRLSLDGLRVGRRTSFLVNGKRRDLADSRFAVLLQLSALRARRSEDYLPGFELGIVNSPEIPSRIRDAVAGAVPPDFSIIQRGEAGMFRLHPLVVVDHIDWPTFERHPHPKTQRIAAAERKRR